MKKLALVAFILFFCSTQLAFAAVVLSEIAWMGSSNSSSDEWIELQNQSSSVADLTGWKITGKGGATIVLLSGSISPNGYFLIERSDDNAVPEVTADLVVSFGKGISNDGETLKLVDGGGTTVDTAVGGKNWSKLGGDKVSKHTAQRTSSGWITAPPTPKAQNKTPSLATEVAPPLQKVVLPRTIPVAYAQTPSSQLVSEKNTVSPSTLVASKAGTTSVPTSTSTQTANVLWERGTDKKEQQHAWAMIMLAVLLVIAAAIFVMRKEEYQPTEADKYAIIEDIIEGKDDKNDRLSDY